MADLQTGERTHAQWWITTSSNDDLAIVAGITVDHGWRMPVLVGLGGLLSLLFYHATFGLAAAYHCLFVARETASVRAWLIVIVVA